MPADTRCVICGNSLAAARPNAGLTSPGRTRIGRPPQYCSAACRTRAWRLRSTRYPDPDITAAGTRMAEAVAALHTASPDEARSIVEGLRADVELLARITAEPVKPRQ